jgi:two-component system OmpR family sensor kinase
VFVAVTYVEYRSSEYQRLDDQLRSSEPVVDQYLDAEVDGARPGAPAGQPEPGERSGTAGPGLGSGPPGEPDGTGAPPVVLPPSTFAELTGPTGQVLAHFVFTASSARPALPTPLPSVSHSGRLFTVAATRGSTRFRVLQVPDGEGGSTVIAIPTTEVTNAVNRLLLIEGAAIAALLVVVSVGAWLVLRRGLRPLERMAHTASRISAGDLSQRVSPASGSSEVGQLGRALNTMLGGIEEAFAEREATEQKLRQFLADASHELRTPLTSIQGFAELFRVSGEPAQVDLPTILRRIEEESARMKVLVDDLLLLARLDEHRPLERKPVDLAVLTADACTDAVATDPERPMSLDAPAPVVVDADEAHLRQAVSNLLTNALRHTPPGTPLEVACHSRDGGAVVTVRDHGAGLDAESLPHVFDRFWQGDKARVGAGAGLGLSIVSAVAAEHGGAASAANAADGGAVFTITLPVQPG